jgi:nitric oxide reductase NorE protein
MADTGEANGRTGDQLLVNGAAYVDRKQPAHAGKHLPGEPGVWVFIFGDMTVFTLFFATYLYYRGQHTAVFDESQHRLAQGFGAAYTAILLSSSLAVCAGMRAVRLNRNDEATRVALRPFVVAIACGVLFVVLKGWEYSQKVRAGITPTTNEFFMYYFVLTGVHLVHLMIGLALLTGLARLASRATLTDRQYMMLEGGSCYWHMVDLLWIVIFALVYLVK